MTAIDRALTEVLEDAMTAVLQKVGGPLIGKVDAYDPATATAQVTPVVPLYVDDELVKPPKLYSVPVLWPASTAHRIHFPLTAGSIVELAPLGHDHSQWMTTGTPNVPPPSTRRVSLADLIAVPMAPSPTNQPPPATSYDSVWGVLWGLWAVGSSAATKAVGLHGDTVDRGPAPADEMSLWMAQVETFINALAAPATPVNPLSTAFTQVGTITATATKLKAE